MALQNPKLFGYEIAAAFTDVSDPSLALRRLNLAPFDLEVIRGSANAGMIPNDWRSFSRLNVPIVKTTHRYTAESNTYLSLIERRAGTNAILFGNLNVNGSISGKALRYSYIDFDDSNRFKIADISTSRVSAWSSSDARSTNNDLSIQQHASISYGAQVGIATASGTLVYGAQGSAKTVDGVTYNDCLGPRLQTTLVPQLKEFNSETPTHKIKVKLGTTDVWLYAMKGIPYTLKGFFRNINASIRLTGFKTDGSGNNIAASWKVVETGNVNRYVNFPDIGGVDTSIAFRSPVSRERFVHFYYDPDFIDMLTVNSGNLSEIPEIRLSNASYFNLSYNQIKNLPDFNFLTPNITTIRLRNNPLYLSETEEERFLNPTTIAKFPDTITSFQLGATWYGSIRGQTTGTESTSGTGTYTSKDLIVRRFNNLVTMDLYRGGGPYFYPDNIVSAILPNIPETTTYYHIGNNDFRSVGATRTSEHSGSYPTATYTNSHFTKGSYNVEDAPALTEAYLYNNHYLQKSANDFTINSDFIQKIHIHNTGLTLPNCQGKDALTHLWASWTYRAWSLFNVSKDTGGSTITNLDYNKKHTQEGYKYDACDAITDMDISHSNLTNDRFPKFTNTNLAYLNLYSTGMKGGSPSGDETNVIPQDTFEECDNLTTVYIRSNNLLSSAINQYTFVNNTKLRNFYYYSYGRTGGNLPDFTANGNLYDLRMMGNNFSGQMPTFAGSPGIWRVNLSDNQLTGPIPGFANLSNLHLLYLFNNKFTTLGTFSGLGNLYRFEAHNNDIGGTIPDFTACSNLYYLILFNNKFNSYTSGSFADLRRIKYIDLANNDLSQQAVNSIIDDMYLNYQTYGSGRRITVNLRGNSTPSEEAIEIILLLRQSGWTITFT